MPRTCRYSRVEPFATQPRSFTTLDMYFTPAIAPIAAASSGVSVEAAPSPVAIRDSSPPRV